MRSCGARTTRIGNPIWERVSSIRSRRAWSMAPTCLGDRSAGTARETRLLQAVVETVDHDHPPSAHQPAGPPPPGQLARRRDDHGVALGDVPELRAKDGRQGGVGEQDRVLVGHPVRDLGGTHVGGQNSHELRLAAVVRARGSGVAVEGTVASGVRIDVVAVREQPSRAEVQRPQEMLKGTMTRSPTCRCCTEEPTSSTTPMSS
jgi:hypothetical protein